jgi:hypothetical protein
MRERRDCHNVLIKILQQVKKNERTSKLSMGNIYMISNITLKTALQAVDPQNFLMIIRQIGGTTKPFDKPSTESPSCLEHAH